MKDVFPVWVRKLFFFLLAAKVVLIMLEDLLRRVSQTEFVIASLVVSGVAYVLLRSRSNSARKARSTSAGERTPVLPRSGR
jgi:hypothetical protein